MAILHRALTLLLPFTSAIAWAQYQPVPAAARPDEPLEMILVKQSARIQKKPLLQIGSFEIQASGAGQPWIFTASVVPGDSAGVRLSAALRVLEDVVNAMSEGDRIDRFALDGVALEVKGSAPTVESVNDLLEQLKSCPWYPPFSSTPYKQVFEKERRIAFVIHAKILTDSDFGWEITGETRAIAHIKAMRIAETPAGPVPDTDHLRFIGILAISEGRMLAVLAMPGGRSQTCPIGYRFQDGVLAAIDPAVGVTVKKDDGTIRVFRIQSRSAPQ
jgi:hypothetical protein